MSRKFLIFLETLFPIFDIHEGEKMIYVKYIWSGMTLWNCHALQAPLYIIVNTSGNITCQQNVSRLWGK